jgi:hypothetical protein
MSGQGFGGLDNSAVIAQDSVDDEIENPDEIVLANEHSHERDEAQSPLALCEVIVEHRCHYSETRRISVVEEVEEVYCWCKG